MSYRVQIRDPVVWRVRVRVRARVFECVHVRERVPQALAFAVVMNSCVKYGLLAYCNRQLPVSTITLSGTVVPALCAGGDYLLFGEVLLPRHLAGCTLILAGLLINSTKDDAFAAAGCSSRGSSSSSSSSSSSGSKSVSVGLWRWWCGWRETAATSRAPS